jgi:hypothetical protein
MERSCSSAISQQYPPTYRRFFRSGFEFEYSLSHLPAAFTEFEEERIECPDGRWEEIEQFDIVAVVL